MKPQVLKQLKSFEMLQKLNQSFGIELGPEGVSLSLHEIFHNILRRGKPVPVFVQDVDTEVVKFSDEVLKAIEHLLP